MEKIFRNCRYADVEFTSCKQCEDFYHCRSMKIARKNRKRRKRVRRLSAQVTMLFLAMLVCALLKFVVFGSSGSATDVETGMDKTQVETIKPEEPEEATESIPQTEIVSYDENSSQDSEIVVLVSEDTSVSAIEVSTEVPQSTEEVKKEIEITEDVELLARVIHGEASICDDTEKYHVGTVPMNRLALPQFPNTLEGVIFDEGQYACASSLYDEDPTEREYEIAYDIIENGVRTLPEKVVFQTGFMPSYGILYLQTEWHYYSESIYIK